MSVLAVVDQLAAQNRELHLGLVKLRDRDLEDVAIDHDEVGELTFFDRTQLVGPVEAEAFDVSRPWSLWLE